MRRYLIGWALSGLLLLGCEQENTLTPGPSPATGRGATSDVASGSLSRLRERVGERDTPARRIVSLTPGLTELVYAVGAEDSLIATVEYADYPEAAKQILRIGDAFRVDMEQLLALKPDLVLVWTSGTPATTVTQIQSLGLRVESIEAQHLSEISSSLRRVGELTGRQTQAQQAAQQFEQGIAQLRAQYAGVLPLRTFIAVNRQPLYTVNGQHVLSEVLSLCGGVNVFAALNQLAPIVGVEAVLKADPEVILSTDGNAQQLRADWQAWPQLRAVSRNQLYTVSPDTTTRATPRLLQGAIAVCAALDQARAQ